MLRVPASTFRQSFGQLMLRALKETVIVTRQGRDEVVVVSVAAYARLRRRERKVGVAGELSPEWVEAVRKGGNQLK